MANTRQRKPQLLWAACLCLAVAVGWPAVAEARGGAGTRIARITASIGKRPDDPKLYLRRAKLHLKQGRADLALQDLERVGELAPDMDQAKLLRARALLDSKQLAAALEQVDSYLRTDEPAPEGRQVRGAILLRMGKFAEAEAELEAYVARVPKPRVSAFLLYADAITGQGDEHLPRAVVWLDRGIMRLGKAPELHLRVVELKVRQGEFYGALARVDEVLETTKHKAPWLAKRGDVLEKAGRHDEARQAYRACLRVLALDGPRQSEAAIRLRKQVEAKVRAEQPY